MAFASSIFSGFRMSTFDDALGRSSFTVSVRSGAVTMKIISSTSTTSGAAYRHVAEALGAAAKAGLAKIAFVSEPVK